MTIKLMFIFIALNFYLTEVLADAPLVECLGEYWPELNADGEQKKYDIKNDSDMVGSRFSCVSGLTPSELNSFLIRFREAIKRNNKEELAHYFRYPFKLNLQEYQNGISIGEKKLVVINGETDFFEYYEEIINQNTTNTVECSSFKNMMAHPYNGVALNLGQIWLDRGENDRSLFVHYLSSSYPSHLLFDKKCKKI